MRIGLFGGSFDPVHNGHLGVARATAEALKLNRVLLIPAAQAPLRDRGVRASGEHRLAMLRLALAELGEREGESRLVVSDYELRRGGVSYTADTLRGLRHEYPEADFVWILGVDQLARLGRWREPEELARLATWAAYARPGYTWPDPDPAAIPGLRVLRIEPAAGLWNLSSSEIRAHIGQGKSLLGAVPDKVIEYIKKNRLYDVH